MTTQYTSILKLALPVQGELSGTWGDVVNDNITSMVEQAIAGRAVINSWSSNSHTLTTANGTTSESRCAMLEFTDTGTQLSGAGTVVCPALSKIYIAKNAAGQNVTLKTASGTGILVPNGRTMFLFCDGTNVVEAVTSTTSLQLGTSTTVTAVLDEDNMASNSATSLATQQSIKAYVDAQVGSFDTLAEVLAQGNTTGSTNIEVTSAQKVQFRDSAIYINSSADGQLDLVADTEIQIAATTIDINGAINASGEIIAASLDISGDVDVDGTLETDALSINGTTVTSTAAELNILDGVTATTAELNYVDGVTSNVQTQLDAKAPIASPTFTGTVTIPTADINAGTIDGTAIGASSASTGAFTTLTATGLNASGTAIVGGLQARATGNIEVGGYNGGTDYGLILTPADGSTWWHMYNDAGGHLAFGHSGTVGSAEKMRIDSSGNVGIGTSSPAYPLHLKTSAGATALFASGGSSDDIQLRFQQNNTFVGAVGYDASEGAVFLNRYGNATVGLTVDSNNNVGIGTSSPSKTLTVAKAQTANTAMEVLRLTGSGAYSSSGSSNAGAGLSFGQYHDTYPDWNLSQIEGIRSGGSWGGSLVFKTNDNTAQTNSTERMRIDSSGNVGIGTTLPSNKMSITGFNEMTLGFPAVSGGASRSGIKPTVTGAGAGQLEFLVGGDNNNEATTVGMAIDSSGSVGIGNSSPSTRLTVGAGSGTEEIRVDAGAGWADVRLHSDATNGGSIYFNDGADAGQIFYYHPDNTMRFHTNASERMRIDASGNLLVGTTDPYPHDNTSGNGVAIGTSGVDVAIADGEALYLNRMGSDGRIVNFRKAGSFVSGIDVTSTTVTYNTSSDQRLKENIADADDAGSKIDAIQVRKFDWKVDGSHQDYGMIAQELQTVAPEAVSGDADSEEMMGVDYSKLVPMLIKEIQSLRNRVAQLEE